MLAAVYTSSTDDVFTDDDDGEEHQVPCGTYTKDDNTKTFLMSAAKAQSTSWPEILNWIKNKAEIKPVS